MRHVLLVGVIFLTASLANADIGPRPRPQPQPQPQPQAIKTKVSIEVDAKATEARLIVPIQVIFGGNLGFGGGAVGFNGGVGAIGGVGVGGFGGAQGAGGVGGGAIGVGGGFGVQGNPPPPQQQPQQQQPQPVAPKPKMSSLPFSTIIVGLSLTLALSFGGLWLVRKKNGNGGGLITPMLVLMAIMGVSMMSGAVWANKAPPFVRPPQPPQPPPAFPALSRFEGVKVEVIPQGDTIRLILTSKQKDIIKAAK